MKPLQIPGLGQITSCIKCGACCRSSSPDLFITDAHLVERGNIPIKYLFTMREGEPIKNLKTRKLEHLTTDIIKIRNISEDAPSCLFFDDDNQDCGIYQHRPSVCRAFKCWDKRQIDNVKTSPFLTRKDLLSETGLWDLIQEHQSRCDYRRVAELADAIIEKDDSDAGHELVAILSYDKAVRDTAIEKGKMDEGMMDFLFGKPVALSLPLFRLRLMTDEDGKQILTR